MNPSQPSQSFATAQIHGGSFKGDPSTKAVTVPIVASTAFTFDSAQHIEDIMSQKVKAFVYSRIGNPTVQSFEDRMAALEGGIGAVATASGQAATMLAVLAVMKAGDSVVVPWKSYGGTVQQWKSFFPRIGITGKFVNSLNPVDFEKQIDETTKAIFIESLANPILELVDIPAFAEIAKKHKIPLIVDNTFGCGGYLIKPIELGANIVVESATKWISGHGTVLGGVVVDGGNFDWAGSGKFPEFTEPLPGYHGMVLSRDCGPMALTIKMRMETLRESGCTLSPFNAFQIIQGLETLSLRVDKQCSNALALAQYLDKHPDVAWVSHPSLPSHPSYELAKKLKHGSGGMVSFILSGDGDGGLGRAMIDKLKWIVHCANVGDVRTLVVNPAATVQRQLEAEELIKSGTPPDLVRVSLGLEDPEDIIADFAQAIAAVVGEKKQ
ncbi:O-acetylhomoserine ami [Leucosporidium creatinivorum]|uniref:O-acetylhomoserine ami n=1 Tax=Leucosporidium creatinivorum TaxID=106004 RepID=A0A1Y2EMM0_9BASI|nr:O-acetylhomoserine ami [Leucosporidium creatinivorum]